VNRRAGGAPGVASPPKQTDEPERAEHVANAKQVEPRVGSRRELVDTLDVVPAVGAGAALRAKRPG